MKLSDIQLERLRQSAHRPGRFPSELEQAGELAGLAPSTNQATSLPSQVVHGAHHGNGAHHGSLPPSAAAWQGAVESKGAPAVSQASGTDWKRPLCRTVTPIGGAPLKSLGDARNFIIELPKGTRQQEMWGQAADLLIKAAESGRASEIEAATFKLEWALLLARRLQRS
jgi:hypothetical protein